MFNMLKVIKKPKLQETRIEMNISGTHVFTDEYLHYLLMEYGRDATLACITDTLISYATESIKKEVNRIAVDILI